MQPSTPSHARRPLAAIASAYALLFIVVGAGLPYLPVWLQSRGLTGEQIGFALGAGMVARFIAAPAVGYLADSFGRRRFVLVVAGVAALAVYAAYFPARDVVALTVLTIAAGAVFAPIVPVLDAVAIGAARTHGFSYARVRSVGSAGFVVASVGVGASIAAFGPDAVLVWLIAGSAGFAATSLALPRDGTGVGPARRTAPLRTLLTGDMALALIASACVQGSHGFYYGFSALAWRAGGVSDTVIGLLWAWGVIAEVIFLAAFGRRAERLGAPLLLAAGAVAGIVRWTLLAFDPGLGVTVVLQTLHAATFAATYLGFVTFVATQVDARSVATAQSVNSALTMGAASAAAMALSGVLFARAGVTGYFAMSAFAAVGLIAALGLGWTLARGERAS